MNAKVSSIIDEIFVSQILAGVLVIPGTLELNENAGTSFRYEIRRKKSVVGMSTGFALDLRTVRLHNSPFPRRNLYDSAVEQTTFPPRQEWAVHVWNRLFRFFFEKNWNAKWTKIHISTRIDGIRTPKFETMLSSRCKELYL